MKKKSNMLKLLNKGFTLSELMLAAAILLIAISGLLVAFIGCILLNESNNNLVIAVDDAQYVLEQIRNSAYSEISNFINNFNPSQFSNLNNETITFPNPNIGARIAEVNVNVSWTERQGQRNFQLSTRIAE